MGRETKLSRTVLLVAAAAVVIAGAAGSTAAEEPTPTSSAGTSDLSRDPSEPRPGVDEAGSSADGRQEAGGREDMAESPSLPRPADDVALPRAAEGRVEEVFEDLVVRGRVIITYPQGPSRRRPHVPW